ncbi:MAG: hypothetical protein K2Y32_02820 [Candidatus Obscuribacterales bacterium]|nr:hypothetical protein [Candidatus Obscuribacterales bacterium]
MHKLYHLISTAMQKMQEYTAQLICGTMVAQVARVFVQPQAAVQKPVYVVTDSLTQDDYGARPR